MSAVIRIKRHINEEPHEAFVLQRKKRKTDGEDAEAVGETSTVLKFAGTVNQDANISDIAKLSKDEAKDIVTRKRPKSNLKARMDQNREKSQQNRFKIVNYTREMSETEEKSPPMTIVDVERTPAPVSAPTSSSYSDIPDEPYVYDIYVAENTALQYPDAIDLNDLSILEYNDYLFSRPRLTNSDSESDDDADEDSNDENNYRNDYPDEEDMSDDSIGEREMRRAMNNFDIDNDLSSDDEDRNGFVYSIDSEAISFEDDLDYCDVNRYGEAYARYKKRVLKDLDEGSDESSDEDQPSNYSGSFHSD